IETNTNTIKITRKSQSVFVHLLSLAVARAYAENRIIVIIFIKNIMLCVYCYKTKTLLPDIKPLQPANRTQKDIFLIIFNPLIRHLYSPIEFGQQSLFDHVHMLLILIQITSVAAHFEHKFVLDMAA